ncbi:MAG: nucleotide exchange factor GrpE, partial [Bacteroidota bacterium]
MKKKDKKDKIDQNKENEPVVDNDTQEVEGKPEEKEEKESTKKEPELSPEEKLQAELAESKDKYLRLYSEFENYRRRTAKEKLDLMQTAGERIVVSLLPVIDDFNRAEQSFDSSEAKEIIEGIKLISDKFVKTLVNEGLKLMDTKEGTDFDPELHDAV